VLHEADLGTGLDEVHGVDLEEGGLGFTSDEFVQIVKGTGKDLNGLVVAGSLSDEDGVLGVTDGGDLIKGGLSINLTFLVLGEINLSSLKRGLALVVMGLSLQEGVSSKFDGLVSESELFLAVTFLDSPHGEMLVFLSFDLVEEFLDGVEDGGQWTTRGHLRLDLSEQRGVGDLVHGFESLLSNSHGASSDKKNGNNGEGFH